MPHPELDNLLSELLGDWESQETAANPEEAQAAPALFESERWEPEVEATLSPSLLNLAATLEDRLAWARNLHLVSRSPAPPPEHRFVQFALGDRMLAVPVTRVVETGYLPELTALPAVDPSIRGLINFRGEVLPLLDLSQVLGSGPATATSQEKVLIVRASAALGVCAIPATRVLGLLTIEPEEIVPANGFFFAGKGELHGAPVHLLDLDRLFQYLTRIAHEGQIAQ